MSDREAASPTFRKLRKCVWCKGDIAARRPLFLVSSDSGQIVGPFHAGCAERLKIEQEKMHAQRGMPNAEVFGTWPRAREETLPW